MSPCSPPRSSARVRLLHVLVSALLAAPTTAAATVSGSSLQTPWERWSTSVPVSGGVRVGIVTDAPVQQLDPNRIFVFIPQEFWGSAVDLCIQVNSKDGRYEGRRERTIKKAAKGANEIDYPTQFARELRGNYNPADLAILASIQPSCNGTAKGYLAASWADSDPTQFVTVLLNSRLPTTIRIGTDRVEATISCQDIPGTSAVAFNLACRIPVEHLRPKVNYVIRIRRASGFNEVQLPLQIERQ